MSELRETSAEHVVIAVESAPEMGAYLARPSRPGTHPGVLVAMELFGVTAHVRDVCDRLARLGFAALAPDLYHRSAPGSELEEDAGGRARGFELLGQLTREQALADVRAAAAALRAQGSESVGMVGLSVGGHVAYLAATACELDAVVVAYGGWIPTTDIPLSRPTPTLAATGAIGARMLMLCGEQDHVVTPEQRTAIAAALSEADVRHELVEYPGVGHGFLCETRASYDAAAAADAWQRIEELFAAEL